MNKMKTLFSIVLFLITASLFATQMWVVGEVFTQTW